MNLLAKIWIGLLTITSLFIFSCSDPTEIGLELNPDAISARLVFEEFTLPVENIFIDSLISSNSSRLLIGKKSDDIYGSVSSSAMIRLSSETSSLIPLVYDIKTTVETNPPGVTVDTVSWQYHVFDSLVLNLEYSSVNTSDSLYLPQSITVHQLDDELLTGVYYLSKFDTPMLPAEPENIFNFVVDKDSLNDALVKANEEPYYILQRRLSDNLGRQLYDIVRNDKTNEKMRTEFKGIGIVPGDNNTSLIGFNPNGLSGVTLHYHIMEEDTTGEITVARDSLEVLFNFTGAGAYYNRIKTDRTGSLIGDNIKGHLEGFETGDGKAYLNSVAGIYPRVSLDPLHEFLSRYNQEEGEYVQVAKAEILINTSKNSGNYNPNVNNTRFIFLKENTNSSSINLGVNDVDTNLLININGTLSTTREELKNVLIADYNAESSSYQASLTYFLQNFQNIEDIQLEGITLMPSDLGIPSSSIIDQSDVKLRLYYAETSN